MLARSSGDAPNGGDGDDRIEGDGGATIHGGPGEDNPDNQGEVDGDAGNNTRYGGGDDRMDASILGTKDKVCPGDDEVIAQDGAGDVMDCGRGDDSITSSDPRDELADNHDNFL